MVFTVILKPTCGPAGLYLNDTVADLIPGRAFLKFQMPDGNSFYYY